MNETKGQVPRASAGASPPAGARADSLSQRPGSGPCTVLKTLRHCTTAPIDDAEQLLDFASFMLRSWKGDFLHRPDGSQSGVTTWTAAGGSDWYVEAIHPAS